MTLKIKINHVILGLAIIMLMLSTNAVAIAQVGEHEGIIPGTSSRETAQTQRAPLEVPGGPGHLMLSAFDFQPLYMDVEWAYFNSRELYNPGVEQGFYFAPVHLPDGATVNKVVLYYYDAVSQDLFLTLKRLNAEGITSVDMAYLGSTGVGEYNYAAESSIAYANIDLANYSYVLRLTIPSGAGIDLTLLHVRIDYDYPTFLPTVLK